MLLYHLSILQSKQWYNIIGDMKITSISGRAEHAIVVYFAKHNNGLHVLKYHLSYTHVQRVSITQFFK